MREGSPRYGVSPGRSADAQGEAKKGRSPLSPFRRGGEVLPKAYPLGYGNFRSMETASEWRTWDSNWCSGDRMIVPLTTELGRVRS